MKVHRPRQNSLTGVLVLLATAASLLLPACSVQPSASPEDPPGIVLQDCELTADGKAVSIQGKCATLSVLEDPAAPAGRKIELNIAIYPAISRSPAPDALFLLAGGPGQPAVETFTPLLGSLIAIHQKRDIVMIDQRGTGRSNPLVCPEDQDLPEDPTPEQAAEYLRSCAAGLDGDPRFYTTAATIEDIEQARAALGYPQINLLGVSYGTRLALAYARAYPAQTRALILDGVAPLDWALGPANAANGQNALDQIVQRCAADPDCQTAFPDLKAELTGLLEQLEKAPVELTLLHPRSGAPTPLTYDRAKLGSTLQLMSYSAEYAALLPLLIHTAAADNRFDPLAAQYLILMGDLEQSISSGLYLSVICSEDVPLYPDTLPAAETFLNFQPEEIIQRCAAWPHNPAAADFSQPVRSDVPTLLLSGGADPVTPPSNAAQAASTLPNSRQIVLPGLGHNVFYYGCLPRLLNEFIQSADPQDLDTTCVESIQPADFFTSFTGSMP